MMAAPGDGRSAHRRPRERSWRSVAVDAALTVAAVLGTVCIALVIAAAAFDVRIMLFRTGSMSPSIPAGSAAIVRHFPAAEVHVGDVVTVDRPGQLPITHRVTGVEKIAGAEDEARRLTLRGDANAADDPFPYDVTRVRLVVFSVPGIAPAVAALGNPWVLGATTIAATALVVWVFWPRREPRREPRQEPPGGQDPANRAPRRTGAVAGVGLLLAVTAAIAVAHPPPARAADDERIVQGSVIRLVSIEEPQMSDLTPGTSAVWQVGVSADAPSPGTITVQLSSGGDPALGLRYDVRSCPQRWDGSVCPAPAILVPEEAVPLDDEPRDILSMPSDEVRWLRVLVTRPADSDPEASGAVGITVRAVGLGDDVSTSPEGLPPTGGAWPWGWAAAGVVLLAAGAGIAVRSRRPAS